MIRNLRYNPLTGTAKRPEFGDVLILGRVNKGTGNKEVCKVTLSPDSRLIQELVDMEVLVPIIINQKKPDLVKPPVKKEYSNKGTKIEERLTKINNSLSYYEGKIGKKLQTLIGDHPNNFYPTLKGLSEVAPSAYLSMIMKEIALELDRSYPNHILDSKVLLGISMVDGKIHAVDKKDFKNPLVIPLFRSEVDAIVALKILSPVMKELFHVRGSRK